jgi:predicted O-methyltransferase YrrM
MMPSFENRLSSYKYSRERKNFNRSDFFRDGEEGKEMDIEHIVHPRIEGYLRNLAPPLDSVLKEMQELGEAEDFPIVGPVVGRLLFQLTLMTGSKRVFEMGSGFGYSAYWFAKAVGEGGQVVYTDLSGDNVSKAREFFRRGGIIDRIRIEIGDALDILDREVGMFDIILNDIDKESYPRVHDLALRRLKPGGLLITDNMLWSGKVVSDGSPDMSTRGIKELTRLLYESHQFYTTIVPIRDGVSISVKLP